MQQISKKIKIILFFLVIIQLVGVSFAEPWYIVADCQNQGGDCVDPKEKCGEGYKDSNLACATVNEKCCVPKQKCPDFICTLACEHGFEAGADGCPVCKCKPEDACTETDEQDSKGTVKGKTTGKLYGQGDIKTFEDYCQDDRTVFEYFCKSPNMIDVSTGFTACEYGCKDGACLEKGTECENKGGKCININENCLSGYQLFPIVCEQGKKCCMPEDYCANEGEQIGTLGPLKKCCEGLTAWASGSDTRISIADKCYRTNRISGYPVSTCINCGNGICHAIENPCNCPQDCTGKSKSTYKTVGEFCGSSDWKEHCIGIDMGFEMCKLCKEEKCTDSDGGKDYFVKGTTKDIEGSFTDYCDTKDTKILYEYYCFNGKSATVEKYECPLGCKDGACIAEDCKNCPKLYAPVCGVNGRTYDNYCFAECNGVEIQYEGKCKDIITFYLTLQSGWNFISFPLKLENNKIEDVLASIAGKYQMVVGQDGAYKVDLPETFRTLFTFEVGKSYQIDITSKEPVKLTIKGTRVTDWKYKLDDGWNWIGYPFLESKQIKDVDFGREYLLIIRHKIGYKPTEDYEEYYYPDNRKDDFDTLEPGKGYLIKITGKEQKTEVTFKVLDSKTEQEIPKSVVKVFEEEKQITDCVTNEKSTCTISLFSSHKYSARASAEGYISSTEPIAFVPQEKPTVTITLKEKPREGQCSDCGILFGIGCNKEKCESLGDCVFIDKLIGSKCEKKLTPLITSVIQIDENPVTKDGQEFTIEGEFTYTDTITCNGPEGCGDVDVNLITE